MSANPKPSLFRRTCCQWVLVLAASALDGVVRETSAQLAITEVMTSAATNCGGVYTRHPDFWELTNYGDNPVDLTGYRFWDADGGGERLELERTIIAAGESIIFVRGRSTTIPDAAAFRVWWWGATSSAVRVYVYANNSSSPGFDDVEDGVLLWDSQTNLVDRLDFGKTAVGVTFFPDRSGAPVGIQSEVGVCGAFRAASCDDIGSPGRAPCGPIPLSIVEQPRSRTNDAGADAKFQIRAGGLPRPRGYQWYFEGMPIGGAAATSNIMPTPVYFGGCGLAWQSAPSLSDLTIRNIQPEHAGQYFVVFTNGLERMTSAVVTLTVNTNRTPPQIECPQYVLWLPAINGGSETSLVVSPGQRAIFDAPIRAYPPATFRWSWSVDGVTFTDLLNATNRWHAIDPVQVTDAGTYKVTVSNPLGTTNAYMHLVVAPEAKLEITEAMAFPCESTESDWWELTNTGDEPVNLTGYRWNDGPSDIGGGPTITNAVVIAPGESIIFLESQTPEAFRQWWGGENLPSTLKFIIYIRNGLHEDGDSLRIWNHSAVHKDDFIDSKEFSGSTRGQSFWFDAELCGHEFGIVSSTGECGAFIAASGCDTGSPGWTRWTRPAFSNIRRVGGAIHLEWKAQPGSANLVQHTSRLAGTATVWTDLAKYTFAGATGTAIDTTLGGNSQRFYRLVRVSAADCACTEPQ